ncbi:MAG: hypothetical protein ABIH26_02330 [Candidatus Eisenbacteria bacterium]
MRKIGLAFLVAVLLAALLLPEGARADERSAPPEDRILETLPLDDLSPREKERVVNAVRKLFRIRRAAGDPGGGEVEKYQEAVELLARYLKRETIEERRRIHAEAAQAFREVDREWIDRAFREAREGNLSPSDASRAKLDDQIAAVERVGAILKEEQAIVARQKSMTAAAERRYREILRLNREGHRLFDSVGHPPIQAALQWMLADLDYALEEIVRPAHDRQVRLVSLYEKFAADVRSTDAALLVRQYRECASKLRTIARHLGRHAAADSD